MLLLDYISINIQYTYVLTTLWIQTTVQVTDGTDAKRLRAKQTDERKFVANGILQNLPIDHEIDRLSLERSTSCLKGLSYTPIKSPYIRTRYVVGEWGLNYENKDVDTNDDVIVEIAFPRRHEYIKKLDNDVIILIERIHHTPNGSKRSSI